MQRSLHILASGLAAALLLLTLAGYAGRWSAVFEITSAFRLHLAVVAGGFGIVLGLLKLRRGAGLALLAALIAAAGLGPVLTGPPPLGAGVAEDGRPLTVI